MNDDQRIRDLIEIGLETESVDFKREFYKKLSLSDAAKDIAAFANCQIGEDKYIIFGIDDDSRSVVGIPMDVICTIESIENYIHETIEPYVNIQLGQIELDGKNVIYLKIPASNNNKPYLIKRDCGKNNCIEKGDIYIRKGACNQKACRMDLDTIYSQQGVRGVKFYENYISITPIQINSSVSFEPTYGRTTIEIANLVKSPLLVCGGYIEINNLYGKIERRIYSILPQINVAEHPLEVLPNNRKTYDVLFDFSSQDCLTLRFEDNGNLLHETFAKITLYDSEGCEYASPESSVFITARGAVLHKTHRFYADFRQYLKRDIGKLKKLIVEKNNSKLNDVIGKDVFSFLQPGYVLGNTEFPEYDFAYELVQTALEYNPAALSVFQSKGMSTDFIEFCKEMRS